MLKDFKEEMHDWHSESDEDGVPMGWIPRRWGRHLEKLDNIEKLLSQLVQEVRRQNGRARD
jgi:hypothetical protein